MKSVDFETMEYSRDEGSATPASLGVEMNTHLDGDSIKVLSNEVGL